MKSRTLPTILAVVVLVTTAGTAAAVVTGSPDISVTFDDNTVAAGEETTLDVVVQNSGDLDSGSSTNPSLNSEVTTARGLTVDIQSNDAPLSITTSQRAVGDLATGSPTTVSFGVSVDDDAEPGAYRVPIELEYDYYNYISQTEGVREDRSVSDTEYVNVRVSDDATFDVVSVDSDVRVGSSGSGTITVQNTGQTNATDATVTLTSQNGELTVGGGEQSSRFVGEWGPGENRTFVYNIGTSDDTETEPYNFDLSISFDDPEGVREEAVGNTVGIVPQPEQEFSLTNATGTVRAGEDGTIEATLTNDGPQTVDNAVVNWASDHSNLSPQETQFAVGRLEAGESTTVSFGVDASDSAREGPRQFDFTVGYDDDGGDRQESETLEIQSQIAPDQDEFDVEPTNATIGPGQSGNIDVTVTNTRDVVLTDISAQLFADSPISTEDDEAFIAELVPGESTTVTFSISSGGSALEKTYPVSMDFQYEEPDGDTPVSDTYRIPIEVTTSGDDGGLPIVAIGAVVVVLVLGVGGYLRFR